MAILASMLDATSQGLQWCVMALGIYISFKILNFADMTCDSSFTLGGMVSATLLTKAGMNPFLTLLIAIIAGAIAGMITGVLHTKFKIPAILSGILTMIAFYSINLRIAGQSNVSITSIGENKKDTVLTSIIKLLPEDIQAVKKIETYTGIVVGLIIAMILIVFLYWFFGTEIGSALRATGNNEAMIRALGVNTDIMKILGLMIGNALIALSGALVAQGQRTANNVMGTGAIVIGISSIVIGEVVLGKKSSFITKLISVVLGSLIYRIIISIVLQLGLNTDDLKLLTALMVVISLSIPLVMEKKKA